MFSDVGILVDMYSELFETYIHSNSLIMRKNSRNVHYFDVLICFTYDLERPLVAWAHGLKFTLQNI